MKKLITLLLALCMCFAICGCGKKEPEITPEQHVRDMIQGTMCIDVAVGLSLGGNEIKQLYPDTSTVTIDGSEWVAYGKVTATDVYGNRWIAQFDAYGTYDEVDDEARVSDIEYDSFTKCS